MQVLVSFFQIFLNYKKKEGAKVARNYINLTRLITLGWALIQSFSIAFYLKRALFDWNLV